MKIAVVAAAGRTGSLVVEQALARGHDVVALARRPEAVGVGSVAAEVEDRHLVRRACDVLDPAAVTQGLAGCDAVVSALGIGTSRAPTVVYSEGVANILTAMGAHSVRRIAVVSAAPVGPRDEQGFMERRVVMPILERFFGATYADMRRMEEELTQSDTDWIAVRPPRLIDGPATGAYRMAIAPPPRARRITYADLATALLDSLERPEFFRHPVFVAE